MIFILKHIEDSEFVILWTSGIKKIQLVNLLFFTSITVLIFYIILSAFLTPIALNKSRQLLSKDQLNSFLPTIRTQQFSDSFKGFTFIVEKKLIMRSKIYSYMIPEKILKIYLLTFQII